MLALKSIWMQWAQKNLPNKKYDTLHIYTPYEGDEEK